MAPALHFSGSNLHGSLKEGARGATSDRGSHTVRRALVVAELALALTLLTGAGLLVKSFARLQGVDPGFDPSHLLTFNLALPATRYPSDTAQIAFFDAVLPRIAQVPGVKAAGATAVLPFGGDWSTASFEIEGYQVPPDQPGPWGDLRLVSPGFFEAMHIPLLQGAGAQRQRPRRLAPGDGGGRGDGAAVLGRTTIRSASGSPSALLPVPPTRRRASGSRSSASSATRSTRGSPPSRVSSTTCRTARSRLAGPHGGCAAPPGNPESYVNAVREAVRSVDPDQPISGVQTMDDLLEQSVGQKKLSMLLLSLFSGIALLLASVGIYGVMSYSVAQRTREIGVRIALGAERGDVLRMVLRQGMRLALAGVGVGLLTAFVLTRVIASQLYDVRPTDPVTFVAVASLLTAVALVANLVPALRATRVDPAVVLREE